MKYPLTTSIQSFSWHTKDFNRLMVSSSAPFNSILDLCVTDYSLLAFSGTNNLNMANGDKVAVLNVNEANKEAAELDIGDKMKQRAIQSYGVGDFLKNIELLSSDGSENDVKYLWYWLDCMNLFCLKAYIFSVY